MTWKLQYASMNAAQRERFTFFGLLGDGPPRGLPTRPRKEVVAGICRDFTDDELRQELGRRAAKRSKKG